MLILLLFLFIPAVTVGTARCQRMFADKFIGAADFVHGVVQMAQRGSQV